jgi:hypothetical protein
VIDEWYWSIGKARGMQCSIATFAIVRTLRVPGQLLLAGLSRKLLRSNSGRKYSEVFGQY